MLRGASQTIQVHWAEDDPEGRPVLVVHLRAALQQDAVGAKRAAEAILTHMECALQQRLRDDMSGPEQVVVVLDSRGAPTLKVLPRGWPFNLLEVGSLTCVEGPVGCPSVALVLMSPALRWLYIAWGTDCCMTEMPVLPIVCPSSLKRQIGRADNSALPMA